MDAGAVWYYKRGDGRWQRYMDAESATLEEAWARNDEEIELQEGLYMLRIADREQRRIGSSNKREVRRGTWHFQRSDGSFEPFDEDIARKLEEAFGAEIPPAEVEVGNSRSVRMLEDGGFEQVRSGGRDPRKVLRRMTMEWTGRGEVGGGQLIVGDEQTRPNLMNDMSEGYAGGYEAGKEAAKALAGLLDADAENTIEQGHEMTHDKAEPVSIFDRPLADAPEAAPTYAELPLFGKGEWFWEYAARKWVALSADASMALELACTRGVRKLELRFEGKDAEILVRERLMRKEGRQELRLLRGSWMYATSSGEMAPYDEEASRRLEEAFVTKPVNGQPEVTAVDVGQGRIVVRLAAGGYVQVRVENHTRRLVTRGGGGRKMDPASLGALVPALKEYRRPGEEDDGKTIAKAAEGGGGAGAGGDESEDSGAEELEGGAARARKAKKGTGGGQAGMDKKSWLGLQDTVGAAVNPDAENGTREVDIWGKGHTENWRVQLSDVREYNAAAAAASQLSVSAHNSAIRAALDAGSQQMIEHLKRVGESLPREIGVVGVPVMGAIGNVLGFSSVIGDWIVGAAGKAANAGIAATNEVSDKMLHGGQMALSGVQTILSAAQAEFVLGVEGAAIMENMINIHEQEFRHIYSDITFMQIARGCAAYAALQRIVRPKSVWAGVARRLKHKEEDRDAALPSVEELTRWLRYLRFCSSAYGRELQIALSVIPASWAAKTDVEALCAKCGIKPENIIHAMWDSQGYAAPAFLIIEEEIRKEVLLVVSGSKGTSDWLTDLRCASVDLPHPVGDNPTDKHSHTWENENFSTPNSKHHCVETHAGIWASAVKLEERCGHIIQKALEDRPGWKLIICGHSLGAGTATLLGLRWRICGRYPDVEVFAFGNPPTVSMPAIAQTRQFVTSIQMADDFVTRWCMGTCIDIVHAGHALAVADGVADQLIGIELLGFDGMKAGGWASAMGRSEEEQFEEQMKRKNKALFDTLLAQQEQQGTLPSFSYDKEGFKYEIRKAEVPDMEWCRGVMKACEERQIAEKLYPGGIVHWICPVKKDPAQQGQKPVWAEIAGGKCDIHHVNVHNGNFGTMALHASIISDHALFPYEKSLEEMLRVQGAPVGSLTTGGWVSLLTKPPE